MSQTYLVPACPGSRTAAWLIDASICVAVVAGTMYLTTGTTHVTAFILATNYTGLGLVVAAPALFHVLVTSSYGRSVGMMLSDLTIVSTESRPLRWTQTGRRPLGVLVMLMTCGMSLLVPLLNENRRSVADFISSSRVIERPAPGAKVSYDTWRIFKSIARPVGIVSFALAIAALLMVKKPDSNKDVLVDSFLAASTFALLVASLIAITKAKLSRVRLRPDGIQRSGWFGWSDKTIPWTDIEYSRVRPARLFPSFEIHKKNRRRFRVPMERDHIQFTAQVLVDHGVRIEQ